MLPFRHVRQGEPQEDGWEEDVQGLSPRDQDGGGRKAGRASPHRGHHHPQHHEVRHGALGDGVYTSSAEQD